MLDSQVNFCKICGEELKDNFHQWVVHAISQKKYYATYYPKTNKLTNDPLEFKSKEQYLLNEFNNRSELQKWTKTVSKEEVYKYIVDYLINRKQLKNITYIPGYLECKTLILPNPSYIINTFGPEIWKKIELDTGLKSKFDYDKIPTFSNKTKQVIIDTRESKPWIFNIEEINKKLDFADYAPIPNPYNIFVERKEISDWAGTFSKGYERFIREMKRAKKNDGYIFLIIEAKMDHLFSINYLPHTKYIKASSDFLLHRCREILNEFDNIQIIAAGNKQDSKELALKIFNCNSDPRQYDFQYLIENNLI